MKTPTRQLVAVALVMAVALGPFIAIRPTSAAPAPDNVIAQGAALAAAAVAVANVDPDVDIWPIYSQSSIDNQSSHGLSGAIWPGFLLDAFAWLYDLQPQERGGLAISESQWPNPPHSSRGSSTGFMVEQLGTGCASFYDPATCARFVEQLGRPPLALGVSESHSGELISNGMARGARFEFPGVAEAAEAWSRTNTVFKGGRSVVESVFVAKNVDIGTDLHIDLIEAKSTAAAAGSRDRSEATSTLRVVGATFGGTPVEIDSRGLHIAGDEGSDALNEQLAEDGLEIRLSQGRQDVDGAGEFVDASTGGLLINVVRERVEETFPEPLVEGKEALCRAAEESALNQEIQRVRVNQENPFYGQIPLTPERVEIEQSVPPPVGCPFLNRNFELTISLGLTAASARLSPLPEFTPEDFGVVVKETGELTPIGTSDVAATTVPSVVVAPSTVLGSAEQADLVGAPLADEAGVRRLRIFYGVLLLLAGLGVAGRFALRAISAP
ncbi:MAG: hypothetical protein ACRDKJ_04030 [Actinomycetota bacterium]